MLKRLKIVNYALIESISIDLGNGLCIVTGETGAGKSILLGALALLQGKRADPKALFDPSKKCIVEGVFQLPDDSVKQFLIQNDLDVESETVVRREISPAGKSRAFINDTPVNLTQLSEFSEYLLDIHSQHQTLSIKESDFQRMVLDVCAVQMTALESYQKDFDSWSASKQRLKALQDRKWELKKDSDYQAYLLQELEEIQPQPNEVEELEDKHNQLKHGAEIVQVALDASQRLLTSDGNASDQLASIAKQLIRLKGMVDQADHWQERLIELSAQVADIGQEIDSLLQRYDFKPEDEDALVERLDALQALFSKHRVSSTSDLIKVWDDLAGGKHSADELDNEIQALEQEVEKGEQSLMSKAEKLSASRHKVLPEVKSRITELLGMMGMNAAQLEIQVQPSDLSATGIDSVTYQFAANKGGLLRPLDKVASGGELSRLMLAIRSLVSDSVALPTMIFDEIDTGVSGEMADKMGRVMKLMSEHMQVISITHLPQIAAKANHHYKVFKSDEGERTTSHIRLLNETEREEELAKMLSGAALTDAAIANARVLLKDDSKATA